MGVARMQRPAAAMAAGVRQVGSAGDVPRAVVATSVEVVVASMAVVEAGVSTAEAVVVDTPAAVVEAMVVDIGRQQVSAGGAVWPPRMVGELAS